MIITTKFAPADSIWFVHPLNGSVVNTVVLTIEIKVDAFGFVTILNFVSYGNISFYINDEVAFPTQAALVAAYTPQVATTAAGASLVLTGIAPVVTVAPAP